MIRAQWNLAATVDSDPGDGQDGDPFAAVTYTSGIEIDLTAPPEELATKLLALVEAESSLLRRGVHCDLKDSGQDCRDCPEATLDPTRRLSKLCRVGKDEHTVWAAGEEHERERMAPVRELAQVADEMSEIGHPAPELLEILRRGR